MQNTMGLIYIYIYKTEVFEAPTIFHVNTIFFFFLFYVLLKLLFFFPY